MELLFSCLFCFIHVANCDDWPVTTTTYIWPALSNDFMMYDTRRMSLVDVIKRFSIDNGYNFQKKKKNRICTITFVHRCIQHVIRIFHIRVLCIMIANDWRFPTYWDNDTTITWKIKMRRGEAFTLIVLFDWVNFSHLLHIYMENIWLHCAHTAAMGEPEKHSNIFNQHSVTIKSVLYYILLLLLLLLQSIHFVSWCIDAYL